MFDHKDGISQRQAARKFKCLVSFVNKTLKMKTQIKAMRKKRIPDRSEVQKRQARQRCGRLLRKFKDFDWIMDDESYFTFKHSTINGNNNFYSSDVDLTSPNVQFNPKAKFEQKILLWICFSVNGFATPYFVPSGMAVNQHVYLKECIIKRLIPFINSFHSNGRYVFWPDLASSHYAKTVIGYLRDKKINFVEKEDNPANLPECRPIETFGVF